LGSVPSPALLTANIKNARTLDELFRNVAAHQRLFNHIHLSACWNALGHLTRCADRDWHQEHATALESLVQYTTTIVSTSSDVRARELANIAHGVARSGQGGSTGSLMAALAGSIEHRVGDCNTQELANVAWAFAKVGGGSYDPLFTALARASEQRAASFNAQELANTAWAFATAGHSNAPLFAALARAIERSLRDFTVQGLSNTMWAFATCGYADEKLFDAMARMVQQRMGELSAQDLAQTAHAFAKVGHAHDTLFTALAGSAERLLDSFSAQGLANTVWAFSKAGHTDAALFTAFAGAIRRRVTEFNAQDIANTAWAFAKACHQNTRLFSALARSAEQCLGQSNVQDLVNTAWAFSKLGEFDASFFAAAAQAIASRRLDDLSAPQISNIAWAFAKAELGDQLDGLLFQALARTAERRAADLSSLDLANVAWAFANASQFDAQLFKALARAAEKLLDEFTEEALDNAEWAFARAGQQKIVRSLRERRKRTGAALTGPAVDVSGCGRIVVAGGGIGGAALAVALQRKGFDVLVLEADRSFDARKQGYGLTIQRQDAIQAMGIDLAQDDAPSTSHYTFSAEGHILGFFGEAFGSKSKERKESNNSGRFIHIPRQMLRARIVEQVRPGTIRWDSKLEGFECWGDSRKGGRDGNGVTVRLTDGTNLDAALLVGADGIFSTVRSQLGLPGDRLNYVGLVVVLGIMDGEIPLAERRIFETVDGTTRIYAMPFTTASTMWQLSFPYAEDAARALVKDPAALKAEIMRRCGQWHEPIPALLGGTPLDGMSGYPVYDREVLEPDVLRAPQTAKAPPSATASPEPQRRVTLMGDAAHPMTPFKAQGANQVLSDAVLLADTLTESVRIHGPHAGFDAALPLFEKKMLSRSARAVVGSREKAKELHSRLALQPGRKVQREVGVDMPKVIRFLRAHGIGARSVADPQGLDALVVQAVERADSGHCTPVLHGASDEQAGSEAKKRPPEASASAGAGLKKSRREGDGTGVGDAKRLPRPGQRSSAANWGFKWRRAICVQLDAAAEGGMRRKHLRRVVLRQYLRHLSERHEASDHGQYWEAHPVELKALFRSHLRRVKKIGQLRTHGKMVCGRLKADG
jgi:2-polyprenyl-6-methoxyphenol hydroxylase-like FAD-dependent oxidoreductase